MGKYISHEDKPTVKVVLGAPYEIVDYRSHKLPHVWIPLRRNGIYYDVMGPNGGTVQIKPAQFKKRVI